MENNIVVDKTEVIHICCKCTEKMELFSSDESTTISEDLEPSTASIMDFQIFKCPSCDEQIWILLRN